MAASTHFTVRIDGSGQTSAPIAKGSLDGVGGPIIFEGHAPAELLNRFHSHLSRAPLGVGIYFTKIGSIDYRIDFTNFA